jgi:hypothetical protein
LPVPEVGQAIFTIEVEVQPLAQALCSPAQAQALHAAVATMSDAVLAYRSLQPVRDALLRWLERAAGPRP